MLAEITGGAVKAILKRRILKKAMLLTELSQNAWAARLKITSGYMSQLMRGSRQPSPRLRRLLLTAINERQKHRDLSELQFEDLFSIKG